MKVIIPPAYERLQSGSDPFELDKFGRARFAQNLTRLFESTNDGLVISINSKWGDGKTTFVKLFGKQLEKNDKFIPIYYDAFQNDFTDDPFLSIAVLIHETLKKKLEQDGGNPKNEAQLEVLKKLTKKLTKELIVMGSGLMVGMVTSGFVSNHGVISWVKNKWERVVTGVMNVNVDEKFNSHITAKTAINSYQEQLKKILETDNKGKKIVFFVDELDRCRPDFAVQVIEKIKHLFNIDNVFFVLTINKEQLLSTISSVYGVEKDDAWVYLQKFIHIETKLPSIELAESSQPYEMLSIYLRELVVLYELSPVFDKNNFDFMEFAELISNSLLSLNPRGIERTFSLISLAAGTTETIVDSPRLKILCAMAAIKVANPKQYEEWKSGKFSFQTSGNPLEKLWNFIKNYLSRDRVDDASNVFTVVNVDEICKILDIYKFPGKYVEAEFKSKSTSTAIAHGSNAAVKSSRDI